MSLAAWTWLITILLCVLFVGMSIKMREQAGNSFLHFAIAGGTLPFMLILFTDVATVLGVGNFVGHAAKGYEIGYANIPFVIGEQGSKIIFALLFAGFAGRFTYITVAEMMDDLLVRDRVSRAIIGVFTACIMIAWVGGQIKGLGDVFAVFAGTDPVPMMIFFSLVFILYTCIGGIYSVVWTELIQGGILLAIGLYYYYQVFGKVHFSISELEMRLNEVGAGHLAQWNLSFTEVLTLFITGCFGILAGQVYWQRCFAAKDGRTASRGMLYSGIVAVVFTCMTTLVGMVAKVVNPDLQASQAMPWMILNEMSAFTVLLMFTLVFLAAISSAASILHSASVIIVNDLIRPFAPQKQERELVNYARWLVVLVGVFSVAAAIWADSIIGLFSMAYTMAGGAVVPVMLVGLLWKRQKGVPFKMGLQNSVLSPWAARIGLIAGSICSLTLGILWGVVISAALAIILSLLIPRTSQEASQSESA